MRGLIPLFVLLVFVPTAHADISDSGNLTIGGQGVIQGSMTVQGSAFSVGGSTFSVLAGTVNAGGLLKVSAAGIQWNDGTVSTTSASAFTASASTQIFNSVFDSAISLGTLGTCVNISSPSFTTRAVPLRLTFSGMIRVSGDTVAAGLSILMDGQFIAPWTKDLPMGGYQAGQTGRDMTVNINVVTPSAVSAGSHQFCVSVKAYSGGTITLRCDATGQPCYLRVEEVL